MFYSLGHYIQVRLKGIGIRLHLVKKIGVSKNLSTYFKATLLLIVTCSTLKWLHLVCTVRSHHAPLVLMTAPWHLCPGAAASFISLCFSVWGEKHKAHLAGNIIGLNLNLNLSFFNLRKTAIWGFVSSLVSSGRGCQLTLWLPSFVWKKNLQNKVSYLKV